MNVIPFPARPASPAAVASTLDRAATIGARALLNSEGFFIQSDEDFLADLGLASNDPHSAYGQRQARRPA